MKTQKIARIILALRADGWDEKRINDFILYVETGEDQYIKIISRYFTAFRRGLRISLRIGFSRLSCLSCFRYCSFLISCF